MRSCGSCVDATHDMLLLYKESGFFSARVLNVMASFSAQFLIDGAEFACGLTVACDLLKKFVFQKKTSFRFAVCFIPRDNL